MSHYWKVFFGWFLSAVVSITLVMSQFPVLSFATEVSADRKAVAHEGTWGDYGINYFMHRKYWTIADTTGITPSTVGAPDFYYTADNVTFYKLTGSEVVSMVLNKGLGIVLKPDSIATFLTPFWTLMNLKEINNNLYAQGAVYDSSDNFLGYALNDITGCYYDPTRSTTVTIPNDFVNDVYYYYNYQTDANLPDFFTYYPPTDSYYSSHYSSTDINYRRRLLSLTSRLGSYIRAQLNFDSSTNRYTTFTHYFGYYSISDYYHLIRQENSTDYYWRNFCNQYQLTINNNSLYFEDLLKYKGSNIASIVYDNYNSNNVIVTTYSGVSITSDDYLVATDNLNQTYLGGCPISTPLGEPITIYKSKSVMDGVKDRTYSPLSYTSNKYITYNPVNDNSFTVNTTTVDNSTTTNETIYEDCNNDYFTYIDNTTVDTTEIINNNSTIINNYYPEAVDPDPEGPDNPPSGGGGDDDDPNIDNETILDAILDALARFFRAIGKILATILAGLLEVVDTVLEAIAGIMENFTGITDFLGALFSWLPSPIPEVIGAGVSICILFAIFRFIRG